MVFQFPFEKGEQKALFVVSLLCIILDTVIVALRLFAARRVQRAFDWSDAALVVAWVSDWISLHLAVWKNGTMLTGPNDSFVRLASARQL